MPALSEFEIRSHILDYTSQGSVCVAAVADKLHKAAGVELDLLIESASVCSCVPTAVCIKLTIPASNSGLIIPVADITPCLAAVICCACRRGTQAELVLLAAYWS